MAEPRIWGMDVGNTHTKIGIIEKNEVIEVFRFRTERDKAVDEYYFQWKSVCHELGIPRIPPIWVASVVPSVSIALERLAEARQLELHWITAQSLFHFQIAPSIAGQIGADLLILAEAAVNLAGKNVIIVSAGTATVVFAVHEGILVGGAIAPGIKGSIESLLSQAALLKPVFLEIPPQVVGENTDDALASGIMYGFAGLIDGLVGRMKEELHIPEAVVIASGGMISKVGKVSRTIQKIYPELGLQGIAFLAR